MTTARQVQKILRPLLARNSDLALVGRLIVINPVRYILRGIYIDATSSADRCRPTWFVTFLFHPHAGIMFNWGDRISSPVEVLWHMSDPRTSAVMCDTIEEMALPLLRPVQTIEDFVGFATKERFPWTPLASYKSRKLFVDLAVGDFASARELCAHFEKRLKIHADRLDNEEVEYFSSIVDVILPLVEAENRTGIGKLLHDVEAKIVVKEKLQHLWQPTPFPIEMT